MDKQNFEYLGLDEKIIKALEKLGYFNPTNVQEKVIPLVFENKDVIVKSQTGSGKTAAFSIPICERIDIEENDPQALVLTPTRELAVQVMEEISNIGRFKRIRCEAVFGKQPIEQQARNLKQRVHVLVGTPGRTIDHIQKGNIKVDKIKYLVIDEADKMLNMGFIEQVESVIEKLPTNRKTLLFSATIPEKILNLCERYMQTPEFIEIESESLTGEKIDQYYYEVDESKKFDLLINLIYTYRPDSCILFCNTKDTVNWLYQKMKEKGYSCNALHGGMEQEDRLEVMKHFKRGGFQFLIATDVAARGIDIEDISLVVNFDVPGEREAYVHRIGRTGRAGSQGIAITLVTSRGKKQFNQIENYLDSKIEQGKIPNKEEIQQGKAIFEEQLKSKVILKRDKSNPLNKEVTKIYIKAGKNKKIRPGDIVGTILSIEGIDGDDIGIIDVQDNISYVDVLNGKGKKVLKELPNLTIKGKKVKIQIASR